MTACSKPNSSQRISNEMPPKLKPNRHNICTKFAQKRSSWIAAQVGENSALVCTSSKKDSLQQKFHFSVNIQRIWLKLGPRPVQYVCQTLLNFRFDQSLGRKWTLGLHLDQWGTKNCPHQNGQKSVNFWAFWLKLEPWTVQYVRFKASSLQ